MAKPERKDYSESDFAELPEGDSFLVVILKADVATSPFKDPKTGEDKQRVEMQFEALEDAYTGSWVWSNPGFSLHPKAPLRAIAQACAPRDMTEDELFDDEDGFDTDKLPGRILRISGQYSEPNANGKKFLRPVMYKRATEAEKKNYADKAAAALERFRGNQPASNGHQAEAQPEPEPVAAAPASGKKIKF